MIDLIPGPPQSPEYKPTIRAARVANWLAIGTLCVLTILYWVEITTYSGVVDRVQRQCGQFAELDRLSSTPILTEIMVICAETMPEKAK